MCVTFLCLNSSASSLLRFKTVFGLKWRLSPTTSFENEKPSQEWCLLLSPMLQQIYKLYAHGRKPCPLETASSLVTPRYSVAKNMPQIFTQSLTIICAFSLHRVITAQGMILIFRKQALLVILGIKVMMEDSEEKAERVLLTHNQHSQRGASLHLLYFITILNSAHLKSVGDRVQVIPNRFYL